MSQRLSERSLPDKTEESVGAIKRAIGCLFEPGVVVELRALRGWETISGYFDEHATLAQTATMLDKQNCAIYVTLNEVDTTSLTRSLKWTPLPTTPPGSGSFTGQRPARATTPRIVHTAVLRS
jgi:hypothetical protein